MSKLVGGRGKKAPYETTHVRVPVPIKSEVERLIEKFHSEGCSDNDDNSYCSCVTALNLVNKFLEDTNSLSKVGDTKKYRDYTALKNFRLWLAKIASS